MSTKHQLAALQLAIMQVLWDRGEATVAEVREALEQAGRPLAHTTVATMLTKLERKKQVDRRAVGRGHAYRSLLKQEQVSRSMMNDLAEKLFAGNVTEMVCHLLDNSEVSAEELARLQDLIRRKQNGETPHA
ncbi:MAG: BlaI/MecI/CopY family transcriptional regulator [Planctomycetales bacterium]